MAAAKCWSQTLRAATAVTFRYAVLGTADTTLVLRIVSTGTLIAFSTTCAASIPQAAVLRALQVQLTPVVAAASGAAITGAVDSAIADAFAPAGLRRCSGRRAWCASISCPRTNSGAAFRKRSQALNYVDRPGGRAPVRPQDSRLERLG